MPTVVSIRLHHVPKNYWFDPNGIELQKGDHTIVKTKRGKEMGLCVREPFEIEASEIKNKLMPVVRVATGDDFEQVDSLQELNFKAMDTFREKVAKYELNMQPAFVEYIFDKSQATFYYTADRRVDFRELVRDLASTLRVHVDMRQIGARDKARAVGGVGHCGQELCCVRMGGSFQSVSMRMAKEQDLPLNPNKISGLCGRLMCCLRYEFEAYKRFKKQSPKLGALIDTPNGAAKVIQIDTVRGEIKMRFEDGTQISAPLDVLDSGEGAPREGQNVRPCHIAADAFDKIIEDLHNDRNFALLGEKLFSHDTQAAAKPAVSARSSESSQRKAHSSYSNSSANKPSSGTHRHRRRRSSASQGQDSRKPRRVRSENAGSSQQASSKDQRQKQKQNVSNKPHPGQYSSSIQLSSDTGSHEKKSFHRRRRRH